MTMMMKVGVYPIKRKRSSIDYGHKPKQNGMDHGLILLAQGQNQIMDLIPDDIHFLNGQFFPMGQIKP